MYLSKSIEELVNEFAKLPGVGKKTAFRYALHFLNSTKEENARFSKALIELKNNIKFCKVCHTPNDEEVCSICANPLRVKNLICVVESYKDLVAVENTNQFFGQYHVLGGVISPMDGIGPDRLNIYSLIERVKVLENSEIVMALNPTIEGDTTIYYLTNLMKTYPVKITTISRGVSFGGELEYTDDLTLGRSIQARQPYELLINK
jgi:recombination protein RecR